jgi:hypothetical protein
MSDVAVAPVLNVVSRVFGSEVVVSSVSVPVSDVLVNSETVVSEDASEVTSVEPSGSDTDETVPEVVSELGVASGLAVVSEVVVG